MSAITKLGDYVAGEIPEPWEYQFLTANGAVIVLTGYTVKVAYKIDEGTQVLRSATLSDGTNGKGTYTWVAGDFTTAGTMRGEMWVGNGTNRFSSNTFELYIRVPAGGTAPAI